MQNVMHVLLTNNIFAGFQHDHGRFLCIYFFVYFLCFFSSQQEQRKRGSESCDLIGYHKTKQNLIGGKGCGYVFKQKGFFLFSSFSCTSEYETPGGSLLICNVSRRCLLLRIDV